MTQKEKNLKRMVYCLETIKKEVLITDTLLGLLDIAEKKLETAYNPVNLKRVKTLEVRIKNRVNRENSICNPLVKKYRKLEALEKI